MKRIIAVGIAVLGGLVVSAWGARQGGDPSSIDALPQGHPPVAWAHPGLPEGHPPLDIPRAALPPGHPPIPSVTAPGCPARERIPGRLPFGAQDGRPTPEGVISI
jgi:hypothetical protein